jgi:hypothetical protein
MKQFDYNKYLKNNPLLKEAKQSRLKESSDPLDTMRQAFMMLTDLQDELKSMKASGNIPSGEEVVDMVLSVISEMEALENEGISTAEPIQEDMSLAANIALGVAGGLAGLYALVKTTKLLGYVAGQGLMALGNKLQSSAKTAAKGRRKEVVMGIIKKFDGDTELQSMYASLPPYTPKTKNERNNQMRKIAAYIKAKLSPEEMDYFTDISAMLRTGDLA